MRQALRVTLATELRIESHDLVIFDPFCISNGKSGWKNDYAHEICTFRKKGPRIPKNYVNLSRRCVKKRDEDKIIISKTD